MSKQTIPEKIRQRRAQMLVHSCAYYELNTQMVDDHTWQRWANELGDLQNQYPEHCNIGYYDSSFHKWDGTSGYDLPLRDPKVYGKTLRLLKYHEEKGVQPVESVVEYTGNLEEFMS